MVSVHSYPSDTVHSQWVFPFVEMSLRVLYMLQWMCPFFYFLILLTGRKRVSFEEFLPIYLSGRSKTERGSLEDFVEGLKVFDKDGNGFINSAELRHVLTSLGKTERDGTHIMQYAAVEYINIHTLQ